MRRSSTVMRARSTAKPHSVKACWHSHWPLMGKYVENIVTHPTFWWIENTENQTWDGHVFQDVVTSFQLFKTQMGAFGENHCFGIFIGPGPGESVSVPISLRLCFMDYHPQRRRSQQCIHRKVCHVVPRSHSITRKWTEIWKIRTTFFFICFIS